MSRCDDRPVGGELRAVIADDAALWREGIARLLDDAGITVVAQAGDAEAFTELVDRERPDVAIADVRMPPTLTDDGLRAAHALQTEKMGSVTGGLDLGSLGGLLG